METTTPEVIEQNAEPGPRASGVGQFAARTAIVLFGLYVFITLSLPDFSDIKDEVKHYVQYYVQRFESPAGKLFLLGIVQNPVVLWKYSERQEAAGNTDIAIGQMELAIGLIEMHGTNAQMMKRYSDRLEKLKAKK